MPMGGAAASREYEADEHWLSLPELGERYKTHVDAANPHKSKGLAQAEAKARVETFGKNRLTPPTPVPEWVKFL